MAVESLKRHKLPGVDQIPAELIKPGGMIICTDIHKLINKGKFHPRPGHEGPDGQ